MTTGSHPQQTESEGIHQPFNWIWADETERLAETVTALDINKEGLQQSDNSRWVLTAVTPTWVCAGGLVRTDNGAGSIIVGDVADTNGANGVNSFVAGSNDSFADGQNSVVIGGDNSAAQTDYSRASGKQAVTRIYGQVAHSAGAFVNDGDAQYSDINIRALVTHGDANWYPLFPNGADDFMIISEDSVWTFDALLVGATVSLGKVFSFRVVGCIKNTGGTTALSGTPTVTTISDGDDVSFDARAVANDTEDSLDIEVQDSDGAGDTVQWSAVVRVVETAFPTP